MGHLTKYWKKYRRLFFISIFCVSCEAACDLLQPRLMSRLIDEGAAKKDLAYVTRLGLLMLAVAGAGAVFALVRNISASRASQGFGADIRSDMFSKMQSFSVEEMDAFEGGSLVVRMTSDITQLQNFAGGMMRIFFKAPIMCIGAIIMASTLNYRTLPIIAPIIAAVAFVIALTMRLTYPRFAKVQKALDRLNTTMREYLAGVRLVKAFGSYELEENRFSGANGELAENTIKAGQTLAIFSPFMALFVNCGIAAIIFLGAGWVSSGQMQVGAIVAFVTYMAQILGSLGMISNVLNMFVRVKTSNDRIREVFLSQDEAHNRQDTGEKTGAKSGAHIAFEGVGFEYRGSTGQAALSGLGFFVEKGETLGVIGPTGSGKSTLAALLMRFYPASSGAIYISGKNIESLPEDELRLRVSLVPQSASLFSGTIKENILWGDQNATESELKLAAEAADAHGFVSALPEGYEAVVGQSGVNLSGGQKQRISIARALLRNPEILILDDCTSALDILTEAKVKRALRQNYGDTTCILITQRISTAMACDKILVLESGLQAGFGSHETLMETCPLYKDIYISQIGQIGGEESYG